MKKKPLETFQKPYLLKCNKTHKGCTLMKLLTASWTPFPHFCGENKNLKEPPPEFSACVFAKISNVAACGKGILIGKLEHN
jgi:hypothetical protein